MAILIRDIFNDTDAVEQLQALFESCSDYFRMHGASLVWAGEETLLWIQMDYVFLLDSLFFFDFF